MSSSDRPRLRAGTRVLARPGGAVQLGGEGYGVVVEGLPAAESALLRLLDGTLSVDDLVARAALGGVSAERVLDLLAVLTTHDLLEPPTSAGTARATVVLDGSGPAADAVGHLLRGCGLRVLAGRETAGLVDDREPDQVVVLLRRHAVAAAEARELLASRVAHLPVVHGPGSVLVGPLVVPDGPGPCLGCCDLTRADRDPAWPGVQAQLLPAGLTSPTGVGEGVALDAITASLTAMVLVAHLDGHPDRAGVSHEVRPPWPRVVARQWPVHPGCTCAAARTRPAPYRRQSAESVTMAG